MLEQKVLVGKLITVDRLPPGAVAAGEVTALDHEALDDAVKRRALVPEAALARGAGARGGGGEHASLLSGVDFYLSRFSENFRFQTLFTFFERHSR